MENVKQWLAEVYDTSTTNVENILKNEKATTYLMVWSVFEQRIFNGSMNLYKIPEKAEEFSGIYETMSLDDIASDFHSRYQDKKLLKNLTHNGKCTKEISEILNKAFAELTNKEKLQLLFYVSYRYRNNIFHGNKAVLSWCKYTEQINNCITFMMQIVNSANGKKG